MHSLKSARLLIWAVTTLLLRSGIPFELSRAAEPVVSIISDENPGPGARHGLEKIIGALGARGIGSERVRARRVARGDVVIVTGLASGSGPLARELRTEGLTVPAGPEALLIHKASRNGKTVLLVAGSDDRGLMYAELDVAERVGWAIDPRQWLATIRNTRETPYVPERAVSKYTMHRSHFESYFYDEKYWARYLDMLARNRFNTFVLIFGYENSGYFAPPYPYFFEVEGFSDVRVVGLSAEQRRRNLETLNRLIEMTHERGLNFTLGIWDHIYRGGVQGPASLSRQPTKGLVWGVTAENLVDFSKAALTKLLHEVRGLDAIQFRMHGESGLKRKEMAAFWADIYGIMKEHAPGIRFDARAKNVPDALIDKALEMGIDIRICTKYWMEQMGLPFHPTHIHPRNQHDRRHGYADLLRYPRRYPVHWRLWSGGTVRVLLWGDPDYVRRFAESTHIYGVGSFEVNEPLATKMQDHPHDLEPFELLGPKYRYYDREFERYWHFYQVWGRMGYDPDTPEEVWHREFEKRFGPEAAPHVERGLHRASQILPRVVAYSYPYNRFPTTRGWVEKQRQEDLAAYARALPSDTQQFESIDDSARGRIEGENSAKISPEESSRWFARAAKDVLDSVTRAENAIGPHRTKEFDSTTVDLKILAHLASYHSARALAGVSWSLYTHSQDVGALDDAIERERRAIAAWGRIVTAAGDVYHDDLRMGRRSEGLSGHWKDELLALEAGLEKLEKQRRDFRVKLDGEGPLIAHVPVRRAIPGEDLVIRATVGSRRPLARVRVLYGIAENLGEHADMKEAAPFVYRALIPGAKVTEGFGYTIEVTDRAGRRTVFPEKGPADPLRVTVTGDHQPPVLQHEPIKTALPGKPLRVSATVRDPSGVQWVRLRYRSVTQYEDFRMLPLVPVGDGDRFVATVPAEHVNPRWDFMYLFEVMDSRGNGKIFPDLETETPYIVVKLAR